MNLLSNPIILCGGIAFGIVIVLISVVVICCKRSSDKEREELKALSMEIESDFSDELVEETADDKIENVLSKMQEALETKESSPVSFEQEQEENAIISYQELLDSLGAHSSIDVDSIELYDDELDNQVEISDFNKEIIDAYQKENLDKEIYMFQNDYSNEELSAQVVEESPVMNFDFSAENVEFVEEETPNQVYEAKHVVSNMPKKFRRTEFISPVYGIVKEEKFDVLKEEDVEEITFDDIDSF